MSEIKKCPQCGQEKPIEDFSKSYRNLCKSCVAENVREKRKSIFDRPAISNFEIPDNSELQFIIPPRLTIATAAMQGLLAGGMLNNSKEFVAAKAVELADALLNELNKPKDKEDEVETDK